MKTNITVFVSILCILFSITGTLSKRYDFCVVGGGTSGGVAADRLAKAGYSVIVLEAGVELPASNPKSQYMNVRNINDIVPFSDNAFGKVPTDSALSATRYYISSEPGLLAGAGKTYVADHPGGGPAVSGLWWGSASSKYWDNLATSLGDQSFSWANMKPLMDSLENVAPSDSPAVRGRTGPLDVVFLDENDPETSPIATSLASGYQVARVRDMVGVNTSYGMFPFQRLLNRNGACNKTASSCVRQTPWSKMLKPTWDAGFYDLEVVLGAEVTQLKIKKINNKPVVIGVVYLVNNTQMEASCKYDTIVAAGALKSPQILQRSGIADATLLQEVGIPLVYNNTWVGKGLKDHFWHYMIFMDYTHNVTDLRSSFSAFFTPAGFPDSGIPNVEVTFQVLPGTSIPGQTYGTALLVVPVQLDGATVDGGFVRIGAINPFSAPILSFGFQTPLIAPLAAAWLQTRGTLAALHPNFVEVYPGTASIPNDFFSTLIGLSGKAGPYYHAVGSLQLGKVVDNHFAVMGVENLRVCDLSVLPTPPNAHPHQTAASLGAKCAIAAIDSLN